MLKNCGKILLDFKQNDFPRSNLISTTKTPTNLSSTIHSLAEAAAAESKKKQVNEQNRQTLYSHYFLIDISFKTFRNLTADRKVIQKRTRLSQRN